MAYTIACDEPCFFVCACGKRSLIVKFHPNHCRIICATISSFAPCGSRLLSLRQGVSSLSVQAFLVPPRRFQGRYRTGGEQKERK